MSDINKLANIKRYGNTYKLTLLKMSPSGKQCNNGAGIKGINENKLECNISRARARIFELSMCNPWQYFITCTLDSKKYDRSDLKKFHSDLSRFIRHQREKFNSDIKYLLIPELHGDGINWHMHGLLKGLKPEMLSDFIPGIHPPKLVQGGYKNWPDYENKFGWVSLWEVREKESISKYITKYITKEVSKSVQEVGSRMFYNSLGLQGCEVIKKGTMAVAPLNWDYENDYVKILWINSNEVNGYIKEGYKNDHNGNV